MKTLFIFLLVTAISFSQNKNLETFLWQQSKPLTWADFKGTPVKNTDAAALTASGISFGFSMGKTGNRVTDFSAEVECVFYPTESWYKPEDATAHILRHEQFHFNITELFARKFRQQISKMKPSQNLRSQLNKLYSRISKGSSQMQHQYDDETNHSINKEKQAAWEIYITAELKKLDAFKSE